MRRRRRGLGSSHEATELSLFIQSDGDIYRRHTQPVIRNLAKKEAKGIYDHARAVKAFSYVVEAGAKQYAREHLTSLSDWHRVFPPAVRREVAEEMAKHFETEYKLGAYRGLKGSRRTYGPTHRVGGYPKGNVLQDWHGNPIGRIVNKSCHRVRPGERGSWISSERCTYTVEIDGRRYTGRGRGDGIAVNLRQMKRRR